MPEGAKSKKTLTLSGRDLCNARSIADNVVRPQPRAPGSAMVEAQVSVKPDIAGHMREADNPRSPVVRFGRDKPLSDVDTFAGRVKRRINKAFTRRDLHKLSWIDGCTSYPVTHDGLARARDYILQNPVRGLLAKRAEDWPYKGTPSPV